MLRFALTLCILVSPALADNVSTVSVSAIVWGGPFHSPVPECGGTLTGTTLAAVSYACDFTSTSYFGVQTTDQFSGAASGATGLGPYGIGASFTDSGSGCPFFADDIQYGNICALEFVNITWSQDFVVEGAQGSGFVDVAISGFDHSGDGNRLTFNLFNTDIPLFFGADGADGIPVTFGEVYTFTVTATAVCSAFDNQYCGVADASVSDLVFRDAAGNVLPDAVLVPVPEIHSLFLLATLALTCVIRRRMAMPRVLASSCRPPLRTIQEE
jgi:hypothetical protein